MDTFVEMRSLTTCKLGKKKYPILIRKKENEQEMQCQEEKWKDRPVESESNNKLKHLEQEKTYLHFLSSHNLHM